VKNEGAQVLVPDFQDLEKDGLHLEIENTPSKISGIYSTVLARLIIDLQKIYDEMVATFNAAAAVVLEKITGIRSVADAASGTDQEVRTIYVGQIDAADAAQADVTGLEPAYTELTQFKLNLLVKTSLDDVMSELGLVLMHLCHLLQWKDGEIALKARQARIAAFKAKALPFVEEAEEFDRSVSATEGDLITRRTVYLQKQVELTGLRDGATVLVPDFADLEKDGLHLEVENTPGKINGIYGGALTRIVTELQKIYDEMVANFNAAASAILEKLAAYRTAADQAAGSDEAIREAYLYSIQVTEPVLAEIQALQPPFDELIQFKLNFKVKSMVVDVNAEHELLLAHLRHLLQGKEGEIALKAKIDRIDGYKAKAQTYVDSSRNLEKEIQAVEETFSGSLQEKLAVYNEKQEKVTTFRSSIDALVPDYEDLVKDDFHLEIEHTPASLAAFIDNLRAHIVTLIQAIDQAIARERGLQIPEAQLAEFRETFTHFDKEGNKLLEPFQLNACLTSLGDPTTDSECEHIVRQYMKNPAAKGIDFEGYVAFMLDRFSKAETNDTTKGAFQSLAGNQPTIIEDQLDKWFAPEDAAYIKSRVPKNDSGAYEYGASVDSIFS
jgi:hypothetical protein